MKTIITLTTVPWRRRLCACAWNTHAFEAVQVPAAATVQFSYPVSICWCWSRDWTFQLYCWNVLWYSSELQWYRVLAGSRGWISTSVHGRHWSDSSPSVTGVCWTPVQRMWRPDGGQVEQNGKTPWTLRISQNELEVHLIMWIVNPVNGRVWC